MQFPVHVIDRARRNYRFRLAADNPAPRCATCSAFSPVVSRRRSVVDCRRLGICISNARQSTCEIHTPRPQEEAGMGEFITAMHSALNAPGA